MMLCLVWCAGGGVLVVALAIAQALKNMLEQYLTILQTDLM